MCCNSTSGSVAVGQRLTKGWKTKVFGQQRRRQSLVCMPFSRQSARSELRSAVFVCRASNFTTFGSTHALSFRVTELLAPGGLLAVVSDEISRKLAARLR